MASHRRREERLRAFLTEGMRLPFVWGERDCSLWPCDWISEIRGVDPAANLRRRYDSLLSCNRILKREGGLVTLAGKLAEAAGLIETDWPVPGDVGVVVTKIGPFLMLCVGDRWVFKTTDGILITSATPLRAWSV